MTMYTHGIPSVNADIGEISPQLISARLLKDILEIIEPIILLSMPSKRSGYSYGTYALYQIIVQFSGLSPEKTGEWLNQACINEGISFQKFEVSEFSNSKKRRYFPDQPALSRCLKELSDLNLTQKFWNGVQFAHLLLLRELKIINDDITLIADYTKEKCKKDKNDPYCFGSKEGKTHHKTLTFSIISKGIHQIVANYPIQKRQNKMPLFEEVMAFLESSGFNVKYALLDREFYRKLLLLAFKKWKVTVIMPGRNCAQTKQKILNYLSGKGKRYCKGFTKLKYVKGVGYPILVFDLLLVAKRKYKLNDILKDFKSKKLTPMDASKRIFPLIVHFANYKGIKTLHGNESYIRYLYRCRWEIEIAFREMNKLGIANRMQNRDARLGTMGAKSLLYNIWQVQRYLVQKENPCAKELQLDEFLGKTYKQRYPTYIQWAVEDIAIC